MAKATPQQINAITARNGNYLVSASAGSGKTYVLTERVFEVIKEGIGLSELLVLTFTNAAAAEMRSRIQKKLIDTGDEKLINIATSLDAANIQTYDAFALNVVKKYHDRLGLAKDVKLVDEAILSIAKHKILNSIFEANFDSHNERVLKLVDEYCYKKLDDLKDFILSLSDKLDLVEDKNSFINDYSKLFINEKRIKQYIDEFLISFKQKMDEAYSKVKTFQNTVYVEKNIDVIDKLRSISTFKELRSLLIDQELSLSASGKASLKDFQTDNAIHKHFLEYLKSIKTKYLIYESEEEIIDQYLSNKDNIETIIEIVRLLDEKTNKYKRRYNAFTFADIFKFAMNLADVPDIKEELKNRYKYIMIDEYQDTSDLQEKFISKIANNNVYVVGDVKQSIYRFRNANCNIFLDKFVKYGKKEGGIRLELPDNFRSRKEVINAVNKIFSKVMKKENSDLDYELEHLMKPGNKSYLDSKESYEAEMLAYDKEDFDALNIKQNEYEARLIATDIALKKQNHFQVYDKDKNELRDCKYSDFAIIIRNKTDFEMYQKVFNEYQIPLFAKFDRTIIENRLTMAFENIIRLIVKTKNNDFKNGYKHAYISLMRSFLIEASDDEVDLVGSTENYEAYPLYNVLHDLVNKIEGKNIKEQLLIIVETFGIYNRAITIGNISDSIALLDYYFNIASQMDNMGYSIEDFVDYFEDLKKFDIVPSFSSNDSVDNSVKLISIHSSKGLQFKICYFPNLNHLFNFKSLNNRFMFDLHFGLSLPNVNHRIVDPFIRTSIAMNERRELIKEEIRLLYVALTRAEEKIILVSNPDKKQTEVGDFFASTSYQDFLSYEKVDLPRYTLKAKLIKEEPMDKDVKGDIEVHPLPKMEGKEIEITHASKALDDDVNDELLMLGNKYHYYLEITDFKSKDVSFIKDEKDKKLLSRFLSNKLFENTKDAKVLHEYPFYDEVNKVSGVIDLLLIYDDHIDIVDFKLSHIDDEAYEKQLKKYKNYISELSALPINTYVTGIMSGEVKEVK